MTTENNKEVAPVDKNVEAMRSATRTIACLGTLLSVIALAFLLDGDAQNQVVGALTTTLGVIITFYFRKHN